MSFHEELKEPSIHNNGCLQDGGGHDLQNGPGGGSKSVLSVF